MAKFTINDKIAVTSINPAVDVIPVWQGSSQKKATPDQIATALNVVQAITANTTITVAAVGGDFTNVQDAIDSLDTKLISTTARIDIAVAAGTHVHTVPIMKDGPFGQYTFIKGTVYTRNVTSIQSSSGSSGAWSIVLNMNSVANIAVNDYIGFVAPTGGTKPTFLAGCHKITNVDAVNTRITITSTHHGAVAPSGAVTCNGTVFKSILSFTACDGIRIWSGMSTLNLEDICIVGTPGSGSAGLSYQDISRLYIAGTVGVVGFQKGVYGITNSECNGDGTLIISSASDFGILMDSGADFSTQYTVISGCGTYGLNANAGGIIAVNNGVITGNVYDGGYAQAGGLLVLSGMKVTGNGRWGLNADTLSSISLIDIPTMSDNVRGDYGNFGLTTFDGSGIFTNFSYGYNGTVTPNGHNIFVGFGAGNWNCGSTATFAAQGSLNVALGEYALASVTTGYNITAIGAAALANVASGDHSAALGSDAGLTIADGSTPNVHNSNSTYVGASTRANADYATNETVLGYGAIGRGSNTVTIGNTDVVSTHCAGVLGHNVLTVATLPAAGTVGSGYRAFVSDSNATLAAGHGNTVANGGSNFVPVYSDGTNWRIG